MYGTIKDGQLIAAPRVVTIGNSVVSNPTEVQLIELGYKPISYTEKPTDEQLGQSYIETWVVNGNSIVQTWELQEVDFDELKELKMAEISEICTDTIHAGIDVELSIETKHFSLTDRDQMNLFAKKDQLNDDIMKNDYEYHSDGEPCRYYTRADMMKIVQSAFSYVSYHTTYCNNLFDWIKKMETADDVRSVYYGIYVPEEYQTEVMVNYYKALENE